MVTGASTVKQERVYHGDHYYLVSASVVNMSDGDKYFVTVMWDCWKDYGAQECASLSDLLVAYDKTVEKYKTTAE